MKILNLFTCMLQLELFHKKIKNEIKTSTDNVLYVDRTNIQNYIPTNLLPYILTPSSDEIKILEYMELNNIEKATTRNRVTIKDLKNVLKFIDVDKKRL